MNSLLSLLPVPTKHPLSPTISMFDYRFSNNEFFSFSRKYWSIEIKLWICRYKFSHGGPMQYEISKYPEGYFVQSKLEKNFNYFHLRNAKKKFNYFHLRNAEMAQLWHYLEEKFHNTIIFKSIYLLYDLMQYSSSL